MDDFIKSTATRNSSIEKGDVFHPFRRKAASRKRQGLSKLRRTRLKRELRKQTVTTEEQG